MSHIFDIKEIESILRAHDLHKEANDFLDDLNTWAILDDQRFVLKKSLPAYLSFKCHTEGVDYVKAAEEHAESAYEVTILGIDFVAI